MSSFSTPKGLSQPDFYFFYWDFSTASSRRAGRRVWKGAGWAGATNTLWWQLWVHLAGIGRGLELAAWGAGPIPITVPIPLPSARSLWGCSRACCSPWHLQLAQDPWIPVPRGHGGSAGLGAVWEAAWPPGCSRAACSSQVKAVLPGQASAKQGRAWLKQKDRVLQFCNTQGCSCGTGCSVPAAPGMFLPHHCLKAGDGWDRAGAGARPRCLACRVMLCFMPVSGSWMVGRVLI